jgi:hypothetical protein
MTHLALAVPDVKTMPLVVVLQSQRNLAGFHVKLLETHEQLEMLAFATVFAVALAHAKQEKVLPLVIMAEFAPQSQKPLGFQISLAIQVHEILVALAKVFVPEVPQTKQLPLRMIVFVTVLQDLHALVCHLSVDRVQVHPPEPLPPVVFVGHWMHKLFNVYAIERSQMHVLEEELHLKGEAHPQSVPTTRPVPGGVLGQLKQPESRVNWSVGLQTIVMQVLVVSDQLGGEVHPQPLPERSPVPPFAVVQV